MTIKTHRPRVSLTCFSFGWWRHNCLLMTSQWPDHCDAITWIMISNSLNIDFILVNIHGLSCKKQWLIPITFHVLVKHGFFFHAVLLVAPMFSGTHITSMCSLYVKNCHRMRPQLCTCHESLAVMACAELWPNMITWINVKAQMIFPKF